MCIFPDCWIYVKMQIRVKRKLRRCWVLTSELIATTRLENEKFRYII